MADPDRDALLVEYLAHVVRWMSPSVKLIAAPRSSAVVGR